MDDSVATSSAKTKNKHLKNNIYRISA